MDTRESDFPELKWIFHQSLDGKSETILLEKCNSDGWAQENSFSRNFKLANSNLTWRGSGYKTHEVCVCEKDKFIG